MGPQAQCSHFDGAPCAPSGALAGICTLAEADGLIGRSPCVDIRLPRIERPPVVPPSIDEVDALAEAVPDRYCAVVLLAAGTGLRQGECFGLSRDRIDDDAAHITVDRQLYTPTQGPPYVAPPKTRASYRRVPLPASVAETLDTYAHLWPDNGDRTRAAINEVLSIPTAVDGGG